MLNGTSVAGLARRNGDALKAAGFHVGTIDSADAAAATTIEYPDGMQSAAKAAAAAIHGAVLVETGSVHRVTVVLGANGVQADGLGPKQATKPPVSTHSTATASAGQPACIN